MKKLLLCFLLVFTLNALGQEKMPYNQKLADSLGADKYGMKVYTFVILKSGTKTYDKPVQDSLMKGHMSNISKLVADGKLIVAGPFQKNEKGFRGLFILNTKNPEEAKQLLMTDPSVSSGIFEVEQYQWYGSAALPIYLPYHDAMIKRD
jgi:uncharacterized protein